MKWIHCRGGKLAETLNITIGSVQSHWLSAGARLIRTSKENLFFGAVPVCCLKLVSNYSGFDRSEAGGRSIHTAALSQAELIAIIQALSDADKIALKQIARLYARRTPFDHDDLLQEAICRVLSGKRVWARGTPVRSFLVGVMRSIAWEWKSEANGAVVDAPDPRCGESPMMASIDSAKIVAMFADDLVAQKIVLGMMEGARGEELQRSSGIGKVQYESKRKKIRRRIENLGG